VTSIYSDAVTTTGPIPERTFGVLLHPSSLPGPDLIGTLGARAHRFVEWLGSTGAGIWQILPLTINGKENSPYFSSSAFAGNFWLVDLEQLREAGLLDNDAVAPFIDGPTHDDRIDFDDLPARKLPALRAAADALRSDPTHAWHAAMAEFVEASPWIDDTCLFFALSAREDDVPWWEWPQPIRKYEPDAVAAARAELADDIERWKAILFLFEVQWRAIRSAANEQGLLVFGDLPIYVAPNSADVWANQEQFQLGADGELTVQSGVPPDYFSANGQLWGNPLYRWDVMADDGYSWWTARLRRCLELTDIVRIDHFRALSAYWEVAGDADDAVAGQWVPGPAQDFFDAMRAAFPDFPFVAEDLGTLDDDVYELRDRNGLPGMRIVQFGFDGTSDNPHLTGAYPEACIAYTGTHDNDPIAGWWQSLDRETREAVGAYYQHGPDADSGRAVWSFIEATFASRAVAAVVPVQDLLVLDSSARMNDPSTPEGNWGWRMPAPPLSDDLARTLHDLADSHGRSRCPRAPARRVS
jgi:4-alpha-glucanotransferase